MPRYSRSVEGSAESASDPPFLNLFPAAAIHGRASMMWSLMRCVSADEEEEEEEEPSVMLYMSLGTDGLSVSVNSYAVAEGEGEPYGGGDDDSSSSSFCVESVRIYALFE